MSAEMGSLFSGAGGLDLAVADLFDATTAWHCENDPAATTVLNAHWPAIPNLGDITEIDWATVPPVDILCGGFPCQDVSAAGRRAGITTGTRSGLWAYFADAIAALRPQLVVIENVRGLLSAKAHRAVESAGAAVGNGANRPVLRAAGAVCGDLADVGYDAQWATVAASEVGAPHRRERVFIVAYGQREGWRRVAPFVETGGIEALGQLLPTPTSRDYKSSGAADVEKSTGPPLSAIDRLLPTPEAKNAHAGPDYARMNRDGSGGHDLVTALALLPPFSTADQLATSWGKYEAAIHRWEILTRPAPPPTEPNTKDNPRLSARFSEWMMGWPDGWTTDHVDRNNALRIIGNGVCPQQATAALKHLLRVQATT